ncbi:MAG: hypothetical protein HN509_14460 [Halobacteriovoraceae bacterium]|jgi:hypothetical protein|nr:hypothetical protein [Halobacteriovoraceae bacterium]MBT5093600.1 hypothetical protein [Halobacteriovoraceae bacterium]
MRAFIYLLTLFSLLVPVVGRAAEVDQFTDRFEFLEDSAERLNTKAATFLDSALIEANNSAAESGSDCHEKDLYKHLRKYFLNHKSGQLTPYVLKSETYPKRKFMKADTIYSEWTVWDGYLLGRKKANSSPVALAPLIRVGEVVVGSDKIEHLFGRGFAYFKRKYLRGKKMKKVFKYGIRGEKTIFGGNKLATGVFSYADLATNFNGMRFWNHMLALRSDIMGQQLGPYVKCQAGKWRKVKDIDFRDYFDDAADEGINCSKFASKNSAKKVRKALERLN